MTIKNRSAKLKSSEVPVRNREATRARIIEAVGKLLAREGFAALGVNAVAREACIDKVLIYRYFGGMKGLISAFGQEGNFWPSMKELAGGDIDTFIRLPLAERASQMTINFMRALRQRPVTQEILAWELIERNEFTMELEIIRENIMKRFIESFLPCDVPGVDTDADGAIIGGAINYLVIRSRNFSRFGGLNLGTEEAWERIEKAMRGIIFSLINAPLT
jgi:AcrR family transcriptional regulator